MIIAIDGFSSCGKSSTAKKIAECMNYVYIDTGAMYRAVALYFIQNNVVADNPQEIEDILKNIKISFHQSTKGHSDTFLNGINVENEIRKIAVSQKVSQISSYPAVRRFLVAQQQEMGKAGSLVMDGRDIGTVVFPNAQLKIFMTAKPEIRSQRRYAECLQKGEDVSLDEIAENLSTRDFNDTNRLESPLRQAIDAIVIDNSDLTFEQQVEMIVTKALQIDTLTSGRPVQAQDTLA